MQAFKNLRSAFKEHGLNITITNPHQVQEAKNHEHANTRGVVPGKAFRRNILHKNNRTLCEINIFPNGTIEVDEELLAQLSDHDHDSIILLMGKIDLEVEKIIRLWESLEEVDPTLLAQIKRRTNKKRGGKEPPKDHS